MFLFSNINLQTQSMGLGAKILSNPNLDNTELKKILEYPEYLLFY